MNYKTAMRKFKTAKALSQVFDPPVTRQAVSRWKIAGVIPFLKAMQLQQITKGAIKVDFRVYEQRISVPRKAAQSASQDRVSL
jgi:hypothetical protein